MRQKMKQLPAGLLLLVTALFIMTTSGSAAAEQLQQVTDPVQIFQEGYIQVVASSSPGQSRYSAIRAAKVLAQRDLLEQLQGVTVSGETTIKDGMSMNDTVLSTVKGFLRGAVTCGEKYNKDDGSADVCLRVNIRGHGSAYDVILPLMQSEGLLPKAKTNFSFAAPTPPPTNTASEQPQPVTAETPTELAPPSQLTNPKDGLILVLAGKGFRPALANRIMTAKQEVIFDPSTIIPAILAERGCGGFTNKVEKAKGLLASWGCNDPLQVEAINVKRGTDAVINIDDAANIFTNDQRSSFLSQAKVVFVVQ